jgi:hypothetical protein
VAQTARCQLAAELDSLRVANEEERMKAQEAEAHSQHTYLTALAAFAEVRIVFAMVQLLIH